MLNVVMLSVIMLIVVMLIVVMLNVIMWIVIMLNAIMLIVIMLNVIMLIVVMLNVIMLIVVTLNVEAPQTHTCILHKSVCCAVTSFISCGQQFSIETKLWLLTNILTRMI
jgi:hypothetical protein